MNSGSSSPQASAHTDQRAGCPTAENKRGPRDIAQPCLNGSFCTLLSSADCYSYSRVQGICQAWKYQPDIFQGAGFNAYRLIAPSAQRHEGEGESKIVEDAPRLSRESKSVAGPTSSQVAQNASGAFPLHSLNSTLNANHQTEPFACDSRSFASLKNLSKSFGQCLATLDTMHAEVIEKCRTGEHVVVKEPQRIKRKLVHNHRVPQGSGDTASKTRNMTEGACHETRCQIGALSGTSTYASAEGSQTAVKNFDTLQGAHCVGDRNPQESENIASPTASAVPRNVGDTSRSFVSTLQARCRTVPTPCSESDSRHFVSMKDLSKSFGECLAAIDAMHAEVTEKCKTGEHIVIKEPKSVRRKLVGTLNHFLHTPPSVQLRGGRCEQKMVEQGTPQRSGNFLSEKKNVTEEPSQKTGSESETRNLVDQSSTMPQASRNISKMKDVTEESCQMTSCESGTLISTSAVEVEESQSQRALRRCRTRTRKQEIRRGRSRWTSRPKGMVPHGSEAADESTVDEASAGCAKQTAEQTPSTIPEADHQVDDDDSDVCSVASDRSGIIHKPKHPQYRRKCASSTSTHKTSSNKKKTSSCRQSPCSSKGPDSKTSKKNSTKKKATPQRKSGQSPKRISKHPPSSQTFVQNRKSSANLADSSKMSPQGRNRGVQKRNLRNSSSSQNSKSSAKQSANSADSSKISRDDVKKQQTSTESKKRALKDKNITDGPSSADGCRHGLWKQRKIADRNKSPVKAKSCQTDAGSSSRNCASNSRLKTSYHNSKRKKHKGAHNKAAMLTPPSAQLRGGRCEHKRVKDLKKGKTKKRAAVKTSVNPLTLTPPSAQLLGGQCESKRVKKTSQKGQQQSGRKSKVSSSRNSPLSTSVNPERTNLKRKSDGNTPNCQKRRKSTTSPKKTRYEEELISKQSAIINHHANESSEPGSCGIVSSTKNGVFSLLCELEERAREMDGSMMEELVTVPKKPAPVNIYSRRPQKNRFGFYGDIDEDAHAGGVWQSILGKK